MTMNSIGIRTFLMSAITMMGATGMGAIVLATPAIADVLFYPSGDAKTVMVTGIGLAKAPADTAKLTFIINNYDPYSPSPAPPDKVDPISPARLKPVTDAIAALGIPASAITINRSPRSFRAGRSSSEATIEVTLDKPTGKQTQQLVEATTQAIAKLKLNATSVTADYRVSNCSALEGAAYQAAVKDAQQRAQAIATGMNVNLAATPAIAEAPFALFYPSCNPEATDSFGFPTRPPQPYSPENNAEVVVRKDIFVTYKVQ
jgi:hypothetical protein